MTLEKVRKLKQCVTKQKQEKFRNKVSKIIIVYRVIFEVIEDGKRVNKGKSGFDTKAAAKAHLDELKDQYKHRTGIFVITPEPAPQLPKVLTFRTYAESYAEWKIKGIKSPKSFNHEIKILVDYFQDTPLNEIDFELITQFEREMREPYLVKRKIKATDRTINPITKRLKYESEFVDVEKNRSDSTVNLYIKRLKNLLYTAKRENKIDDRPDFHKVVKSENNKKTTDITFAEFERLLAVCTGDRKHLYLQVLCIYESSARLSEMKAIRKKDLNVETRMCEVIISKQKFGAKHREPRRCYFSRRLIEAIKADGYDQKSDNDFLFDTGDNKRAWKTAKKLAFNNMENADRKEKLLDLQMQRSLRKSAGINYDESEIREYVKEYQMGHAPDTTGGKHYREVKEKLQFEQFQKYEIYSNDERAKLQKAMTATG